MYTKSLTRRSCSSNKCIQNSWLQILTGVSFVYKSEGGLILNEVEYANEEIKHFSDLIDGHFSIDDDKKHELLRYIRLEIIGVIQT